MNPVPENGSTYTEEDFYFEIFILALDLQKGTIMKSVMTQDIYNAGSDELRKFWDALFPDPRFKFSAAGKWLETYIAQRSLLRGSKIKFMEDLTVQAIPPEPRNEMKCEGIRKILDTPLHGISSIPPLQGAPPYIVKPLFYPNVDKPDVNEITIPMIYELLLKLCVYYHEEYPNGAPISLINEFFGNTVSWKRYEDFLKSLSPCRVKFEDPEKRRDKWASPSIVVKMNMSSIDEKNVKDYARHRLLCRNIEELLRFVIQKKAISFIGICKELNLDPKSDIMALKPACNGKLVFKTHAGKGFVMLPKTETIVHPRNN